MRIQQDVDTKFLMNQYDQFRKYKLPFWMKVNLWLIQNNSPAFFNSSIH